MMEIETLVDSLVATNDNKYKAKEIDEALTRRDEIIPLLIDILENILSNPDEYIENEKYFGHMYALLLLGHFKAKRAHDIILKIFSLPGKITYELFGDITTENLPILLLNTCDGCFDSIKHFVLNRDVDEFCRGSALKAMMYGVASDSISRDEVLSFYRSVLENRESESPSFFFDEMAACICHLYPLELMDLIKECLKDGYIHPGFIGIESFESALKLGKEGCLENIKKDMERDSLEDIHAAISWWACFEGNQSESYKQNSFTFTDKFQNKSYKKKNKKKRKISKVSKRKNRKKK